MKVPVVDAPSVAPSGELYNNTSPQLRKPDSSISDSIAGFGTDAGKATDALVKAGKKIQEESDAVNVADGISSYQKDLTNDKYGSKNEDGSENVGFLSMEGKSAFEQNAAHLDGLEKSRLKIKESMKNDNQRNQFEIHSRQMLEKQRTDYGDHAFKQGIKVKEESTKALHNTMIDRVYQHPDDLNALRADRNTYLDLALRTNLGLSKEEIEATVNSTQSDITTARIRGYMAQGRPEDARTLMDSLDGDAIGAKSMEVIRGKVADALEAKELKDISQQTEEVINYSIKQSKNSDGLVDVNKAEAEFAKVPFGDSKIHGRAISEFNARLSGEVRARKAYIEKFTGNGQLAFTNGGSRIAAVIAMDDGLTAGKVQKYNSDRWNVWVQREKQMTDRANRLNNGGAGARAAAAEQRAENKLALTRMKRQMHEMLPGERTEFSVNNFASDYSLDPQGMADLELEKSKNYSKDGTAQNVDKDKFMTSAMNKLRPAIRARSGGNIQREADIEADIVNNLDEAYDMNSAQKKAPLTSDEEGQILAKEEGNMTYGSKWFGLGEAKGPKMFHGAYAREHDEAQPKDSSPVVVQPSVKSKSPTRVRQIKKTGSAALFWLMSDGTTEAAK